MMDEEEFAVARLLAGGPKRENEIGAESGTKREVLARCVEAEYVANKGREFSLALPVVRAADEERMAEALAPVCVRLSEARSAWAAGRLELAGEQGFGWLVENHPDAVEKGLEGLPGLRPALEREGFLAPLPKAAGPCWGMWLRIE